MQNDIKLFYDLTAGKTADQWYEEEILKPTLEDFMSLFSNNPKILDLGCGTGHESNRLHQLGATVVGIDFSDECIRIAKERTPQCRFEAVDFRNLDKNLGIFDGVFACASLIHINPKELSGVMKNIRSVLMDGGYFGVIIVYGEGIKEEWSILEVDGKKLRRTFYLYTKQMLLNECSKVGLKFVREGFLDEKLTEYGWKYCIFKVNK